MFSVNMDLLIKELMALMAANDDLTKRVTRLEKQVVELAKKVANER